MTSDDELVSLAKRAFVFTFPWVASYHTMGKMTADPGTGEPFRAYINDVQVNDRTFSAADRTMPGLNSSNFTGGIWLDLRNDALVVTVPATDDPARYYSLMLWDTYHYISTPAGSRLGNVGQEQKVLFHSAFSNWDGVVPHGVDHVIEVETAFAGCGWRLGINPFDPDDLAGARNVLQAIAVDEVRPLRRLPAAERPAIDWLPIGDDYDDLIRSEHYFEVVKFMARHSTPHPNDAPEWAVLDQLGLGAAGGFDETSSAPELVTTMRAAVSEAHAELSASQLPSSDGVFLSRADVAGDEADYYPKNAQAAYFGYIGQPNYEVTYLVTTQDADGDELDGTESSYTIRYEDGQLPPVNAFWAYTLYEQPNLYLYDNPHDKYTVDSMQGYDVATDGSVTIHVSHTRPDDVSLRNWIPAPQGPCMLILRLYVPAEPVLDGTWAQPPVQKARGTTDDH